MRERRKNYRWMISQLQNVKKVKIGKGDEQKNETGVNAVVVDKGQLKRRKERRMQKFQRDDQPIAERKDSKTRDRR